MNVGTEFVPLGVKLAVPFVPVAVRVCVCVANAEPVKTSAGTVPALPVKVSAGTVNELPGDEPPIVLNAPLLVPALLPETVATLAVPLVPAGVNETVPFVPAGVPALTALVVALLPVNVCAGTVHTEPVKVGAVTVPAGVKAAVPFVPAGV